MADQPITSDLRHFAGNDADTRICRHAADLIEALEAEIERLRAELSDARRLKDHLLSRLNELEARYG